jgi:protein-disulfide isomerase
MRRIQFSVFFAAFLFSATSFGSNASLTYKGKRLEASKLSNSDRQKIYDIELEHYKRMTMALEEAGLNLYFEEKAKGSKKSVEQVREAELKAKEPTEAEVKKFYESNKSRIPYPYKKVKPQIKQWVAQTKVAETKEALVNKLKKQGAIRISLKEPVAPKFDIETRSFQAKGNLKSKVEVVEFADYQCPHCKHAFESVQSVMKKYGKKVKLVFVDYPINSSGISKKVAEGAYCASEQGKYWEYHALAFNKQSTLSMDSPIKLAKELKLSKGKFSACLKNPATAKYVEKGKNLGESLGITGTPTFYINGQKYSGGLEPQDLSAAFEKALR